MATMRVVHYLVFFVCVLVEMSNCDIRLVNNGYENVPIFIKESVKEDPKLIQRIKDGFTIASAFMLKATKNRVYFRNFTIVIPKTWKNTKTDLQLPSVRVSGEEIRIEHTKKDTAFVRGISQCGTPGLYMQLTPRRLDRAVNLGTQDHVIVHEWGHLRWGLFDEYPTLQYPNTTTPDKRIHFYNENGQWRPVTCSREIKGGAYRGRCDRSKPCNLKSLTVPPECKFCPDDYKTATSSLMAHSWIPNLESFCEEDVDSTDPSKRHNSKAPNKHNKYCNGKSAWEVMANHKDFKDGNSPAISPNTNTVPTFQVVRQSGRIRVFVYDVSSSMDGPKIIQQKSASYVVIDNVIETGSWLGLVEFTSSASVLADLTELTDVAKREELKSRVPVNADGDTDIYSGLRKAVLVIEGSAFSTQGTEIVLLSDGESNHPYIHIIPMLQEKGITVYTIAITQQADTNMTRLAEETGGKSYTYLEAASVSFVDVLSQVVSSGTSDANAIQRLYGNTSTISSDSPYTNTFIIDDGLGISTTITIIRNAGSSPITLNVTGPNRLFYTKTTNDQILSVKLNGSAPVGKYEYKVSTTSSSNTVIDVIITTHPVSDEAEVVQVTSFFSNSTLDFNVEEQMQMFVIVEKAGSPVLNANVTAVLAGDSYFTARRLVLKDNGIGADLTAYDGIYSVYILKAYFTTDNRYNVKVTVAGDDGTFMYTTGPGTDVAAPLPEALDDEDYTPVTVGQFQRQSIPGEITVVNYRPGDITPPARILDLRVESITRNNDAEDRTLTYVFVWTAVGEDMDLGTATKYEMRMHADNRYVRHNFDNCSEVPVNLTKPKPSGETESYEVTFDVTDCNGTCYLAVRAIDQTGLIGDISNLVNVDIDFTYDPVEVFHDDDNPDRFLSNEAIYAIAGVAIVFIIVIVAVSLVFVCRRKMKKPKSRGQALPLYLETHPLFVSQAFINNRRTSC